MRSVVSLHMSAEDPLLLRAARGEVRLAPLCCTSTYELSVVLDEPQLFISFPIGGREDTSMDDETSWKAHAGLLWRFVPLIFMSRT